MKRPIRAGQEKTKVENEPRDADENYKESMIFVLTSD